MSTPEPTSPTTSATSRPPTPPTGRTLLRGVRVFDGQQLTEPRTVVLDGAVIGTDATGTEVVDAGGGVLLPGLIDAHVHLSGPQSLDLLCSYGVTTALVMASWPPPLTRGLQGLPGTTDTRSSGTPAIGGGGPQARIPGLAEHAVVRGPEQAEAFVEARVAEGSDYLKIVLEAPGRGGPDQATADALVAAAHARGLRVVAHAAVSAACGMALDAGVDVLTHAPLDRPLDDTEVARAVSAGTIVVPTLTMMEGTAAGRPGASYDAAAQTVTALHRAGVPVLAGTDANTQPGVPFQAPHGESIHHELELLVAAGLSTAEALRAATSLPAQWFALPDRGRVEPGLRADLVLLDADPLADVRATRSIRRVWVGGAEHAVAGPVAP